MANFPSALQLPILPPIQAMVPGEHSVVSVSPVKNLLNSFACSRLALACAGETGAVWVGAGSTDGICVITETSGGVGDKAVEVADIAGDEIEGGIAVGCTKLEAVIDKLGMIGVAVSNGVEDSDGEVGVILSLGELRLVGL